MSDLQAALRLHADTRPDMPSNLAVWAETAQRLMREAAAECDRMGTAWVKETRNNEALVAALNGIVEIYANLVNSGDAGFWDPEKDAEVIAARAAIAKATGQP